MSARLFVSTLANLAIGVLAVGAASESFAADMAVKALGCD
jgi:hypothetical protein